MSGVYTDSLQAWRRYENHLAPLVKLIGERTKYNLKTTLKGYELPPPEGNKDTTSNPEADESKQDESQTAYSEHANEDDEIQPELIHSLKDHAEGNEKDEL
jgi:hypothetical protein